MMSTADIALKTDPEYLKISNHFQENQLRLKRLLLRLGSSYVTEIWGLKNST